MGYTTPFLATTGMTISSSGWNTSSRDNIEYLKGRAGTVDIEAGATFNGDVRVPNNFGYRSKTSGGSDITILKIGGDNWTYLGEPGLSGTVIQTNGDVYHNKSGTWYKLWDESNDGAGSGLNADLWQGLSPSAKSDVGHSHGSFVPLSGDSDIAGIVTVNKLKADERGNDPAICAIQVTQATMGLFAFDASPNDLHFAVPTSGDVGKIQASNGLLFWNFGISGASITNRSDRRIKVDIVPFAPDAAAVLRELNVTKFKYRNDPTGTEQVGFIAQDVEEVAPWAVTHDEDNDELGLSVMALISMLVEGWKNVDGRLQQLEAA